MLEPMITIDMKVDEVDDDDGNNLVICETLVSENSFVCNKCNRHYKSKAHLIVHLQNHGAVKSKKKKLFQCDFCAYQFATAKFLNEHLKNDHNKSIPIQKKLNRNGSNEISQDDDNIACPECKKIFTSTPNLVRHMRSHTGEKPYSCTFCGRKFAESTALTKHTRIHTGEKPYGCTVCHKRFTESGTLQKHLLVHTGEKPYGCNVCNKRFTEAGALTKHERIHTGERPYACTVCNKRFTVSSTLNEHMTQHTGVKPFACSLCEKRFTRTGHLLSHMKKQHKQND